MTDLFTAIGNFGFPIVVASYLLFRFEKKIELLSKNIEANTQIIKDLIKALETSSKGIKISNQQNGLS